MTLQQPSDCRWGRKKVPDSLAAKRLNKSSESGDPPRWRSRLCHRFPRNSLMDLCGCFMVFLQAVLRNHSASWCRMLQEIRDVVYIPFHAPWGHNKWCTQKASPIVWCSFRSPRDGPWDEDGPVQPRFSVDTPQNDLSKYRLLQIVPKNTTILPHGKKNNPPPVRFVLPAHDPPGVAASMAGNSKDMVSGSRKWPTGFLRPSFPRNRNQGLYIWFTWIKPNYPN